MRPTRSFLGSYVLFLGSYVLFLGSYVLFLGSYVLFLGSYVLFLGSYVLFLGSYVLCGTGFVTIVIPFFGFPKQGRYITLLIKKLQKSPLFRPKKKVIDTMVFLSYNYANGERKAVARKKRKKESLMFKNRPTFVTNAAERQYIDNVLQELRSNHCVDMDAVTTIEGVMDYHAALGNKSTVEFLAGRLAAARAAAAAPRTIVNSASMAEFTSNYNGYRRNRLIAAAAVATWYATETAWVRHAMDAMVAASDARSTADAIHDIVSDMDAAHNRYTDLFSFLPAEYKNDDDAAAAAERAYNSAAAAVVTARRATAAAMDAADAAARNDAAAVAAAAMDAREYRDVVDALYMDAADATDDARSFYESGVDAAMFERACSIEDAVERRQTGRYY